MLFFAETFQVMNAAVTFQIGLKDSAQAIAGNLRLQVQGKFSGNPDEP